MKDKIYIGTRNSLLAICQAQAVEKKFIEKGWKTKIITIESQGDKNIIKPISQLKKNITGIFTKELDIALINHQIDIAVHSVKDIPTKLPLELELSAVLPRDFPQDVLIRNPNSNKKINFENLTLLTGSIRRKAFWKNFYKNGKFDTVRGNLNTRLQKLKESSADGTFLSLAGIKRLNLDIQYEILEFMISAPAQGVIGVVSHIENKKIKQFLTFINHQPTMQCIKLEREFLHLLNGGCAAPIGAFAKIKNNVIYFSAQLSSLDGDRFIKINKIIKSRNDILHLVNNILTHDGQSIISEIRDINK